MAKAKTKKTTEKPDVLELDYQLAELPSSQHRAGLAGLVLMVDWLKKLPEEKRQVMDMAIKTVNGRVPA